MPYIIIIIESYRWCKLIWYRVVPPTVLTSMYGLALGPCRYKQIVGEKHRSYAATLNNLGLVYLTQATQAHKLQAMGLLDRSVL
jgi:hypothetical protein